MTTTSSGSQVFFRDSKAPFGFRWRNKNTITNTANPKGLKGKLVKVRTWNRTFREGNAKYQFRLFGARPSAFYDANSFIRALEGRGFKRLGSGAFSTVLGKDGHHRVLKVNRRPDTWIDYAVWAAKNGEAGKLAPKVFSYKTIKGKKNDFSVAVVERIHYTVQDVPTDHALKILPDLLYYSDNPIAARFADMLAPGLSAYVQEIRTTFDEGRLDLHNENLMVRQDGSFVVVDPVAGESTGKYKRLKAGDFTPAVSLLMAA